MDDEGLLIARRLLDAGANVNRTSGGWRAFTPLHRACSDGTVAMVELLLSRGAIATALAYPGKDTALLLALGNATFGPDMIPLLVRAGVNVAAVGSDGETAIQHAARAGSRMIRALAPYVPHADQLERFYPANSCGDPIGLWTEASRFGWMPLPQYFGAAILSDFVPQHCWAALRIGAPLVFDGSEQDVFVTMEGVTNKKLWRLVVGEVNVTRHPETLDTLLHVAARANNVEAVRECCAANLNPLLRNAAGRLAVELSSDVDLRVELVRYALWRPTRIATQWYGPYFRKRARAWLRVCAHWSRIRTRVVQRDVQLRIVQYVAATEETFARRLG